MWGNVQSFLFWYAEEKSSRSIEGGGNRQRVVIPIAVLAAAAYFKVDLSNEETGMIRWKIEPGCQRF